MRRSDLLRALRREALVWGVAVALGLLLFL